MKKYKGGHPRFYVILDQLKELHSRKNTDYAKGGVQGALGNFHRVSQFKQLYPSMDWSTPFGVCISFMLKQLDAALILAATKRKSITGEPVTSRLDDIIIYSTIGKILWEESETPKRKMEKRHGLRKLKAAK